MADQDAMKPSTEQIVKAYETVYLLKWLFPETQIERFRKSIEKSRSALFQQFNQNFLQSTQAESEASNYWDKFEIVDDDKDDYDSEEDVEMQNQEQVPENDVEDEMINEPIEDIDSDVEEDYLNNH